MKNALRHLPSGVWALGLVCLLMDISSEMIHSLRPLFMVSVLWDKQGAAYTFYAGAAFCVAALIGLGKKHPPARQT